MVGAGKGDISIADKKLSEAQTNLHTNDNGPRTGINTQELRYIQVNRKERSETMEPNDKGTNKWNELNSQITDKSDKGQFNN